MNLHDLRDELSSRAADADHHAGDPLPGVQRKIRRTKRRRAVTALGAAAVLAAVAAGLAPTLTSTTPPADTPPADYTRDGQTVPGTVRNDKLLKAWIGDRGQDKVSFVWTPTTDSIALRSNCETTGSGMFAIRYTINGWYVGSGVCDTGPDAWSMGSTATVEPDDALWLDSPVGKPARVTAEVVDMDTHRTDAENARISLGIYSTEPTSVVNGAPVRIAPPGPDDYRKDGLTYRTRIGGNTLAAAQIGDPGQNEVRFSFTATGAKLVLHDFCTANAGSDSADPPYAVSMRIGGRPYGSICQAASVDAGSQGSSLTVDSPVPAGQRVDVVARVVPTHPKGPAVPSNVRLGLGVYFEGPQRVVDGTQLPERTEIGGYTYRLAELKTAPAPDGRLTTETPADRPYVVAYSASALGTGRFRTALTVGESEMSAEVAAGAAGPGVGWDPHGAGPAGHATLTISEDKPTKGTLILAIYVPD